MSSWKVGDVAHVRGRGDFVIADARIIARGRLAGKVEYTLAPLSAGAIRRTAYALAVKTDSSLEACSSRYSADRVQEAIEKYTEVLMGIREQRDEVRERSATAIEAHGLQPGMIADIKYKTGVRPEIVAKVDEGTGRVALAQAGGKVRWIPARFVVGARHQHRPLPVKPGDAGMDRLLDKGWTHIKVKHSDVIAQSYVVAFKAEDAARKEDWRGEGRGDAVYYDNKLNIYWRNAGSMD